MRRIRLRFDGTCRVCGAALAAGEPGMWDPDARTVTCLACIEPTARAGGSARAEYDRRRARREERIRGRFGRLGGLAVALSREPAHQRNWARGAEGEERLAAWLKRSTASKGVEWLEDLRMPRTRANIDLLAVGPAGVLVIDAKRYRGRVEVRRRRGQLIVNGRDRTASVDGALRQVEAVRAALGPAAVPVRGVLCFVEGWLPLFATLELRHVLICKPRRAARLCAADGPLAPDTMRDVARALARGLPPA